MIIATNIMVIDKILLYPGESEQALHLPSFHTFPYAL